AKLASVDADKQTVTLKGDEGTPQTIRVAADVDLTTVKAGDEVTAKLTKGVALWVTGPQQQEEARPAAEKQKPAGQPADDDFVVDAATATAMVEAVDPKKRDVTLKTSGGATRMIH